MALAVLLFSEGFDQRFKRILEIEEWELEQIGHIFTKNIGLNELGQK